MKEDFEDQLRRAIHSDDIEIRSDTEQAIRAGRRIVRGRRLGWGVAASAIALAAALIVPGMLQLPLPAVPAPAATRSSTASAVPDPSRRLAGTAWVAERLNDAPLAPGSRISLEFANDRVSGYDGCNWFSQAGVDRAGYRQDGDRLSIGEFGTTLRLCTAPGVNEQEQAFTDALPRVARFQIVNSRLILLDSLGASLVEFRPFTADGRTWTLDASTGKWVGEHSGITLFVDGATVSGSTTCGSYTARLSRDGPGWTISDIKKQPISCPYDAGHRASEFLDHLARVTLAEVYAAGPTLRLRTPGSELVFSIR